MDTAVYFLNGWKEFGGAMVFVLVAAGCWLLLLGRSILHATFVCG